MPGTETGGARVEGITEGVLMVEDSDNYYGSVFLGPDQEHKIIVVKLSKFLGENFSKFLGENFCPWLNLL